jgi:hypothetical protein
MMEDNSHKIILDLFGGSGAWSDPYRKADYQVYMITLPQFDISKEEVVKHCISLNPYGILCAIQCTIWANSGVRWWKDRTPDEVFYNSMLLVKSLRIINGTNPVFWALENPVGKMREMMGDPELIFDPCDYGDPYTKKTLIWGKFNIPQKNRVETIGNNPIHYMSPGKNRAAKRSITPPGFASAFFRANQ